MNFGFIVPQQGAKCHFGMNCTKQNCPYQHPATKKDGKEKLPCHFGMNCTKQNCPYQHPATKKDGKEKPPSHFGMNCTNPSCSYQHPTGPVDDELASARLQCVRQLASNTVYETPISSAVRACFMAGGEVNCLLFPGECVSVQVANLPAEATTEQLLTLAAQYGELRECSVYELNTLGDNGAPVCGAKIVYKEKKDAATALVALQGAMLCNAALSVRPGGEFIPESTEQVRSQRCRMLLSWSVTPSTGFAMITFHTREDAAHALPLLQAAGLSASVFVVKKNSQTPVQGVPAYKSQLVISGLLSTADERDVEELVLRQHCRRPLRVVVKRETESDLTGDASTALSVQVAELTALIPLRDRIVSIETSSLYKNTRATIEVQYTDDAVAAEAMLKWRTKRSKELRKRQRGPMRAGQKIRFEQIHSTLLLYSGILLKPFKPALTSLLQGFHQEHADFSFQITPPAWEKGNFSIKIFAQQLPVLDAVSVGIEELLRSRMFSFLSSDCVSVLLSSAGVQALTALNNTALSCFKLPKHPQAYAIVVNVKRKTIHVYGESERGVQDIRQVYTDLSKNQLHWKAYTTSKAALGSMLKRSTAWIAEFALFTCALEGQKLTVSGPAARVEALQVKLLAEGLVTETAPDKQVRRAASGAECLLCYDSPPVDAFTPVACAHVGCLECLQNGFTGVENKTDVQLPVCCADPSCKQPYAWRDIVALTSEGGLAFLKDAAVSKYVLQHPDRVRRCVDPTCENILDLRRVRTAREEAEQAQLGGQCLVDCAECAHTYCLECSDRDNEPVRRHRGVRCSMAGKADRVDVRTHFNRITNDIMNLKCPRCRNPFLDFEGCFALTCSNGSCNCPFCAFCLKDCGKDAHEHVSNCKLNPSKGQYWPAQPVETFNRIHCQRRTAEIQAYLNNIPSAEVRTAVIELLQSVLEGTGIIVK